MQLSGLAKAHEPFHFIILSALAMATGEVM